MYGSVKQKRRKHYINPKIIWSTKLFTTVCVDSLNKLSAFCGYYIIAIKPLCFKNQDAIPSYVRSLQGMNFTC